MKTFHCYFMALFNYLHCFFNLITRCLMWLFTFFFFFFFPAVPPRVNQQFQNDTLKYFMLTRNDSKVIQCNASNENGYLWADFYLNVLGKYELMLKFNLVSWYYANTIKMVVFSFEGINVLIMFTTVKFINICTNTTSLHSEVSLNSISFIDIK